MTFYSGSLFPEWRGNLFIASMAPRIGRKLIRLEVAETAQGWRITGEEWLLAADGGVRLRDVKQGVDGALYVLSDDGSLESGNRVYRIVPR
jgi:glucose/arabinose dehydrogenase